MSSSNPNASPDDGSPTPAPERNLMPPPPRPPQVQAQAQSLTQAQSQGESSSSTTRQQISDAIAIDSDDSDMDSDSDTARPGPSPRNTMHKVNTLQDLAEQRVLSQLMEAVQGYQATANYSCGGTIPISTSLSEDGPAYGSSKRPISAPSVVIRFDNASGGVGKVEFPLVESLEQEDALKELLEACTPATFGSGGKDVLDESYRKAGKLDRSGFSTDFHPHDYGIVDAIKQTLLPGINRPRLEGGNVDEEHWGVCAELYKLNVS